MKHDRIQSDRYRQAYRGERVLTFYLPALLAGIIAMHLANALPGTALSPFGSNPSVSPLRASIAFAGDTQ